MLSKFTDPGWKDGFAEEIRKARETIATNPLYRCSFYPNILLLQNNFAAGTMYGFVFGPHGSMCEWSVEEALLAFSLTPLRDVRVVLVAIREIISFRDKSQLTVRSNDFASVLLSLPELLLVFACDVQE